MKKILAIILTLVTIIGCFAYGSTTMAETNDESTEVTTPIIEEEPMTTPCEHVYGDGVVTKESTCAKKGTISYTCSLCGEIKTEETKLKSHTYAEIVSKKATTEANGNIETKACKVCGKKASSNETKTVYKIKSVEQSAKTFAYNGKSHTPKITIKDSKGNTLVKNTDYTLKYSVKNPTKVGTYKITITFKDKYSGKAEVSYKITEKSHSYINVIDKPATTEADGKCTTKVCEGCDKKVTLEKEEATIAKIKSIKLSGTKYNYNGSKHVPTVTVTDANGKKLKKNTDYTVTYSNSKSTKVGTYKVTIKFKGCYKGTKELTYKITEKEHKYNVKADTRATLTANGKATTKICEGCGKKVKLSKAASIAKVTTISLSKTKLTYTGKAQKPSVTVKDSKGNKLVKDKDYTVTYENENSKKAGTYKVTIKLKGNYKGSKELTYKIVKPATGVATAITGVTAKNLKKTVTYKVTAKDYNDKNNRKFVTATKKIGNGVKVTWDERKGISYYEVQYSLRNDFARGSKENWFWYTDAKEFVESTYSEVVPADKTSFTIHGTIKATYYIRVRAIIEKNGKNTISPWSKTVKVDASYNCADVDYKTTSLIYNGNSKHLCSNYKQHDAIIAGEKYGRNCEYCGEDPCMNTYIYYSVGEYKGFNCNQCPKKPWVDPNKCEYCGKTTCIRYINSCNCPNCGAYVKGRTCHDCPKYNLHK